MNPKNWIAITIILMAQMMGVTGCNENDTKENVNTIATEEKNKEVNGDANDVFLINKKIAKKAGLKVVWEAKLPMKKNEQLKKITILNNRLYVFSSQNFMSCLQRQNGNPIFSRYITTPGLPLICIDSYENGLFSVVGNKITEMDPVTGTDKAVKNIKYGITADVVRNKKYYYLPATDNRLHVLRVKDKVQVFEMSAISKGTITSVEVDEHFVIFATIKGDVIAALADEPKKAWQYNTTGKIIAPITVDEKSVFVAGDDAKLYKINKINGKLIWTYHTTEGLKRKPIVTENIVYQFVENEGLLAIDKKTAKLLWKQTKAKCLLAKDEQKTYLLGQNGEIIIVDNKKNEKQTVLKFLNIKVCGVNTVDNLIYVADENGRLACLKPCE